ncbi:hypothetical protein [Asaia spathodeae]|uniref:MAE-28990/MAE-18760-like HEPN domain-containing protein n=1 Tax=Asaia spathodeae TaxID=657016 RepID=A0ABX2P9W7_9PROT|nr:hypothetical protein [Asaia spathodeae]GBR18738.1 hypothetical protein AA105894_2142 [Asaia spathodeae NBRC 105894]
MSIRDRVIYLDGVNGASSELFGIDEIRTASYFGPGNPADEVFFALSHASHIGRKKLRSCYIRWALTINALHAAHDRYENNPDIALQVWFIRQKSIFAPRLDPMLTLDNDKTKKNTRKCIDVISAYGIYDIYGCFEEIIFDLYEVYLRYLPNQLLQGDEYRELRRMYRNRHESDAARIEWETAFSRRLEDWRRKKTYSPLAKTFEALLGDVNLLKIGCFSDGANLNGVIRVIDIAAELRNIITHGGHTVTDRLDALCLGGADMLFPFKKGMEIVVSRNEFSAVEFYFDKTIFDINASINKIITD